VADRELNGIRKGETKFAVFFAANPATNDLEIDHGVIAGSRRA